MFRKELIPLLLDRSLSIRQIAREAGERPPAVADDLRHLVRSLEHSNYIFVVTPARCRKCDFEFAPDKLTKPSKCPHCRGTWIAEPRVGLRPKPDRTSSSE